MKTLCLLLCLLPFLGSLDEARGEEIIIESSPQGQNHDQYSEPEGKWIDSRTPPASAKSAAPGLTPQGECGSRKILFWRASGAMTTAPAAARFTPRLRTSGRYAVYATWSVAANANPVHYVIRHVGGESVVRMRQDGRGAGGTANANRWVALGEYLFAPDAGHFVELRLEKETAPITRAAFGQIVADAVKFTPVDSSAAQQPDASLVAGGLPAAPASEPAAPLEWLTDLGQAQAAAGRSGRRILIFFDLPTSEACRRYSENLFSHAGLRALLSRQFVLVRLDMSRHPDLASSLRAYRAGTINLYDSRGEAIGQISDRVEPEEMLARLRNL